MENSIKDSKPVKVVIPLKPTEQNFEQSNVDADGFEPWELDAEEEIPNDDDIR